MFSQKDAKKTIESHSIVFFRGAAHDRTAWLEESTVNSCPPPARSVWPEKSKKNSYQIQLPPAEAGSTVTFLPIRKS